MDRQLATVGFRPVDRRLPVVVFVAAAGVAFFAFFLGVAGGVVVAANNNAPAHNIVRISIQTVFFNRLSGTQTRMPMLLLRDGTGQVRANPFSWNSGLGSTCSACGRLHDMEYDRLAGFERAPDARHIFGAHYRLTIDRGDD